MADVLEGQVVETRRDALRLARMLGCEGAHEVEGGWMACESQEAFQALLTGGRYGYRQYQESKGLGSAIGKIRDVANGPDVPGNRPNKRRLRRVAFNPHAEDRDADQIVQEGTTQERRIGRTVESAARRSNNKPDGPKAPKARAEAAVKPVKTRVRLDPSRGMGRLLHRDRFREVALEERPFSQRTLDHFDARIKKVGGVGRPRGLADGPLPEAHTQRLIIKKKVEKKYGKIESVEDMESALKKAFPQAHVDLFKLYKFGRDTKGPTGRIQGADLGGEEGFFNTFGENSVGTMEALRGLTYGLLWKSMDDPENARRLGSIEMVRNSSFHAAVGTGLVQPVDAPAAMWLSPEAIYLETQLLWGDDSTLGVIQQSAKVAEAMENRDRIKGTDAANIGVTSALADSDIELYGMSIASHEWGHLAGAAVARDSIDDAVIDQMQEWVKTGVISDAKGAPMSMAEMDGLTSSLKMSVAKLVGPVAKDPEAARKAKEFFATLGFSGVNPADPAQVSAVYRALAVRQAFGIMINHRAYSERQSISPKDWKKMDGISPYANYNAEEAIAELFAITEIAPDLAAAMFPGAYNLPEVKKRLR